MKKSIVDVNVKDQRCLVRVDFNVPLDGNKNITDDNRVKAALPTIKYLLEQGAKVILMSHLGRPKGQFNDKYSLAPAAKRLGELLGMEVKLATDVVGDSANTAHYAGMKVNRIVLRTVFLSASLIGLAAAFKVGSSGVLSTAITDDVGWTGIIVAWLAQLNTVMIFVVSALICVLQFGSVNAASEFARVDSSFANMLQGLILFLVLAADFFIRFRIARTKKGE